MICGECPGLLEGDYRDDMARAAIAKATGGADMIPLINPATLQAQASRNAMRLDLCRRLRQLWHLLPEPSRRAVETLERYAEGAATHDDLHDAYSLAAAAALAINRQVVDGNARHLYPAMKAAQAVAWACSPYPAYWVSARAAQIRIQEAIDANKRVSSAH